MKRLVVSVVVLLAVAPVAAGTIVVDAGRGVSVNVPAGYQPGVPAPLMIALHGYTSSGAAIDSYVQLTSLSEQYGFVLAAPDGTTDIFGSPFWNATDACCDLGNTGVDDSSYLIELVRQIRLQLDIDPWRTWFVGHSNGGFMSYRMACDHADAIAAIGSLAGATYDDPLDCTPATPVHVLQVHGTSDTTILYNGGSLFGVPYPGAMETFDTWSGYDGCDGAISTSPAFNLEPNIPGDETTVQRRVTGCEPSGSAELWTIAGGGHLPALTTTFRRRLIDYLFAHRKAGFVFDDRTTMHWLPLRWAASWRVYRGAVADIGSGGYGDCLGDAAGTTFDDSDVPPAGTGYFYLAGFVDEQGTDSALGSTSAGAPREPAVICP